MANNKYCGTAADYQPVSEDQSRVVIMYGMKEDGDKADIADVVIRMLNNSKPLTSIADVKVAIPKAAPLIDKLNLQIEK